MTIIRMLGARIVLSILTLFIVSIIIFALLEVLPGDVASRILGRDATPEALALLRAKLHLNEPAVIRYFTWLGGVLRGDFGKAVTSSRPISEILAPRLFNSALLSLYAFLIYIPLSLIPALIQASRRDREVDHVISVINLVFLSIPDFLLGTCLLVLFCVAIPILPAVSLVDQSSSAMHYLRAMTLPAITLAIAMAIAAVRMLRDNLIEVLDFGICADGGIEGPAIACRSAAPRTAKCLGSDPQCNGD